MRRYNHIKANKGFVCVKKNHINTINYSNIFKCFWKFFCYDQYVHENDKL